MPVPAARFFHRDELILLFDNDDVDDDAVVVNDAVVRWSMLYKINHKGRTTLCALQFTLIFHQLRSTCKFPDGARESNRNGKRGSVSDTNFCAVARVLPAQCFGHCRWLAFTWSWFKELSKLWRGWCGAVDGLTLQQSSKIVRHQACKHAPVGTRNSLHLRLNHE